MHAARNVSFFAANYLQGSRSILTAETVKTSSFLRDQFQTAFEDFAVILYKTSYKGKLDKSKKIDI